MWGFASNAISGIGIKKSLSFQSQARSDEDEDDEVRSNESKDEGLECPICCESFNIVENVPYVLWCGHTLCKNCVFGLQWAVLKFPAQQLKVPFFVSCPWCHLLSLRLVYKGNLKFPRKNFFLLWMVESLNGDRVKFGSSFGDETQLGLIRSSDPDRGNLVQNSSVAIRRSFSSSGSLTHDGDRAVQSQVDRHYFSLHKSIDLFIHLTSKFPLVVVLLLIVFCVIPGSAIVLTVYFLLTVLFAIPSFLVLYFAYPTLRRLLREITS